MTRDELEFSISQYLDGNLVGEEESALEERLAGDADARALLAEYRGLDRALRSMPAPAVDFEALAGSISEAVARAEEPAQSYRMHWVRTASALALAACVVIAAGVGIRMMQTPGTTGNGQAVRPDVAPAAEPRRIVVVDSVNRPEVSKESALVVNVGPPAAAEGRPTFARYHEDLLSRPSQVIIARSGYEATESRTQDGPLAP